MASYIPRFLVLLVTIEKVFDPSSVTVALHLDPYKVIPIPLFAVRKTPIFNLDTYVIFPKLHILSPDLLFVRYIIEPDRFVMLNLSCLVKP